MPEEKYPKSVLVDGYYKVVKYSSWRQFCDDLLAIAPGGLTKPDMQLFAVDFEHDETYCLTAIYAPLPGDSALASQP